MAEYDNDPQLSELEDDHLLVEAAQQEANFDKAEELESVQAEIINAEGISYNDVITLEKICPGILLDNYPPGGWTEERSTKNLKPSLEFISQKTAMFAGAGLLGVLAIIFKFFWKKKSESSKDGGGTESRTYKEVSDTQKTTETAATECDSEIAKLTANIGNYTLQLDEKHRGKIKNELNNLGLSRDKLNEITATDDKIREYMRKEYFTESRYHILKGYVYSFILDTHAPNAFNHLKPVLKKISDHLAKRKETLNAVAVAELTLLGWCQVVPADLSKIPVVKPVRTDDVEEIKHFLIAIGNDKITTNSHPSEVSRAFIAYIDSLVALVFTTDENKVRQFCKTLPNIAAFEKKVEGFVEGIGQEIHALNAALGSDLKARTEEFDKRSAESSEATRECKQFLDKQSPEIQAAVRAARKEAADYYKECILIYRAIERLDKAYDRLFRDLNTRASVYKAKINFYKDLLNYIGPSK